ncbi:hypothetical protein TOPH_03307, partial [Tolypocladium ophioglossoides CBS 100239]
FRHDWSQQQRLQLPRRAKSQQTQRFQQLPRQAKIAEPAVGHLSPAGSDSHYETRASRFTRRNIVSRPRQRAFDDGLCLK